jgi:hypothetical protein
MSSVNNLPSDLTNIVQEFYDTKALEKPQFENDILSFGKQIIIPKGQSKVGHLNRFDDFGLATKMTNEATEPSSGRQISTQAVVVQLDEFADYVSIPVYGNEQLVLDAVEESYELFQRQMERTASHYILKDLIVGDVTGSNSFTAFKKMYAGGADSFGNTNSPVTGKDLQRAVAFLKKNQAPGPYGIFIDPFTQEDLLVHDAEFRALMQAQRVSVFEADKIDKWAGSRILNQSEPWREDVEGTYAAGGSIVTCLVCSLSQGYGRVKFMGRTGTKPKFHAQNISVTGATMTVGYRFPSKGAPLKSTWGVALKGKTTDASVSSVSE